jgi:hypothetical protein
MDGMSVATKSATMAHGLVWGIESVADFNGDGKADILWRTTTTGALQVWLMDGMSVATKGATVARDLVWEIVG